MDAYREFIEPSRVGQTLGCNFISPTNKHLVIGKASLLQVFEVITLPIEPKYRLKLVDQYNLHGLITDLKAIRTAESSNLDYVIVSTTFAKFSIIKWDHVLNTIQTVSLHYYENMIQNATHEKLSKTRLLIEPTYNSCTCLRFKNLLTFLPFEGIHDEDEDEDDDDIKVDDKDDKKEGNGTIKKSGQIFDSSFLIDGASLDPSIGDIIDVQFLHNFREPTIAVISQNSRAWAGNLIKVKDTVQFMVLTLDLETRSTVSVLKVENLPYDIDRVIPLPTPLNGCLLVGCNELIHVDNGGIVRRIAVNQFTSSITASTKNYVDQTLLNLFLEYSTVIPLPNDNRLLLILTNGEFYYINFIVDGKSIKSFGIETIPLEQYENIRLSYVSETTTLDNNLIFLGNENGNSVLIESVYEEILPIEVPILKVEEDSADEDDEGLYNDDDDDDEKKVQVRKSTIKFVKHDELINNGPISNFTMGFYSTEKYKSNLQNPNFGEVSIVANAGTHKDAKLNIITPSIQPFVSSSLSFSQINRMWTINKKYLITSDDTDAKSEIFQIEKKYSRLNSKDFINDESTISIHEMGKFILQVTPKKIVLYNEDFIKCLSLSEEIKDDEIINGTLTDEFLMIFLSSGDVMIFAINTYNESYTKIEIPKILSDTIITTGYITNSNLLNAVLKDVNLLLNRGTKRRHVVQSRTLKGVGSRQKTFILATGDNRIVAFNRFHNQKCFQLNDVDKYTDYLSLGFFEPTTNYPDPIIKQLILNDLGDKDHKEEYLTLLTIGGEIIMYKLFFDGENYRFIKEKGLPITGAPNNAYPIGTALERRLAYLPNLNGYTSIFVTGLTPYLVLKPAHSPARIFKFSKIEAVSVAPYYDSKVTDGLIFLDNKKNARICSIPLDFNYDNLWPMKHIEIGELIKSIAYHETSNTYVLSTFKDIPYDCLDEEGKPIVGVDTSKPSAISYKGSIKLISPINWSVIDEIELADNELGMTIKSMVLDIGSTVKKYKNKRELIVVGTGKYRMEDLSANGSFIILEIIDIIPKPGKPETNHKFKEVFKEDTRGSATAICEVSGRFLVAQGQKIIVRDLQDNGVVPVAFLDTAVYVSEAKSFGNLVILGDSLKSVWLVGFDAEPFRMIMLGKDLQSIDVSSADFIVKDREIYLLIADNNNVLHLIQYDPDDPYSLNGLRLINKASFQLNSSVTCFKSIPRTEESYDYEKKVKTVSVLGDFQTIGSTTDGSFFTVFPINEATYRRMYILQQQLIDKEYHYCGLNPRLNRFGGLSIAENDVNTKPILDYQVIKSFSKLNDDRKTLLANKVSKRAHQDIWKDIIELENVLKDM